MIKKPELLAPAGDLEKLKWAINYGADAVYIGGPFLGLRANAKNFTLEEIKEGCCYAHERGKKVYVTVNIILHNIELKHVKRFLQELDKIKVDAIIVSDPAIIQLAKQYTNLEIHLSTQQSTLNYEAVEYWCQEGVSRIVLGREASLDDIQEIKQKVPIEIECFIHGAMCASLSGRCVMSNFLTNRDANRGGCAQICRWDFDLLDENQSKIDAPKRFTFCSKDLSSLEYLPQMIDSNIDSFKIEGRMRSVYYIATIVNIYRKVIDEYCSNPKKYQYRQEYEKILRNCANRDAITQFIAGINDERLGYYNGREEVSNQDFLGIVLDYDKNNKMATIEQRNYFKKGDIIEIFGPEIDTITYEINTIFDEEGNNIDIVRHPKQIVKIPIAEEIYPNNLLRIKRN